MDTLASHNNGKSTFNSGIIRKMGRSSCVLAAVYSFMKQSMVYSFSNKYGTMNNRRLFAHGTNIFSANPNIPTSNEVRKFTSLEMSTVDAPSTTTILKRVKTADIKSSHEAIESKERVMIKGWVRTVRKQKTLAFVEINDGSNLKGVQCVLTLDEMDEDTKEGAIYAEILFI